MTKTRIATGDALTILRLLPDQVFNCCITSPPYWLLRDYGVDGQLGLEPTPAEYIAKLVTVFDEVWRVLRDDGTCWVVLGDTYFGSNKGAGATGPKLESFRFARKPKEVGGKAKCLAQIPARFAIAMTDRGWLLRNTIIWHKPNVIPSSARDRFTIDYEFVFFFSKQRKYQFERQLEASKYPGGKNSLKRAGSKGDFIKRVMNQTYFDRNVVTGAFRNLRSVWSIPTARCDDPHFAVFPQPLVEIPIKAGCPVDGIVLDPFCGSGTTAIVCERLQRSSFNIELNPDYVKIAKKRIREARDRANKPSSRKTGSAPQQPHKNLRIPGPHGMHMLRIKSAAQYIRPDDTESAEGKVTPPYPAIHIDCSQDEFVEI